MATVITTHKVRSYEEWRPYFDADSERRSSVGMTNETVYRSANDPNEVTIMWETDNPSVLDQMMSDPELKNKMEEAGVISEPNFSVLNRA